MAYIGRTPTNAALTASDLADGIVSTAKIAADAVTDAKIADDVVGTEHLTANEVDTAALGADAVTGAQLADNAVNSEHYTDGSIDTAHIAADQITAAKIADDAISEEHLDVTAITGHTAETSVADGDLVVIHDASATALRKMTVANLIANAGGGSLVKLASTTLSSAAAGIAFNSTYITSTYDNYYVLINGIMPVTDNADIGVYLSVDNGSNFATITSGNHYLGIHDGGNGWQLNQNAHYVAHDCSNATGELKVNGYALIENVNDTTCWKSIYGRGMTQNSGTKTTDYAYATYSAFHSTTAVNYLIVKSNSGNLQGFGTVTLYGVEK